MREIGKGNGEETEERNGGEKGGRSGGAEWETQAGCGREKNSSAFYKALLQHGKRLNLLEIWRTRSWRAGPACIMAYRPWGLKDAVGDRGWCLVFPCHGS